MRIQVFWDVTPCLAEQFLTVQRMVGGCKCSGT